MTKQILLKDDLKWYEPRLPILHRIFGEFDSLTKDCHCEIIISSKAYAVEDVFKVLDGMKNKQVTYDVVICEPVGSVATIFVCGAKNIYMAKGASIAPLDPTVPCHGFPLFKYGGQPYHNNPAEKDALINFVVDVCGSAEAEGVLLAIDRTYSNTTQQSLERLKTIQNKLMSYMSLQPIDKQIEAAHYLTVGAGSWDQRIHRDDLMKLGFQVTEYIEGKNDE